MKKKQYKQFFKDLKPYYIYILVIVMCSILATIFTIVGPKVLGDATTTLYEGVINKINGVGFIDFKTIHKILITLIILYIISAIFNYLQGLIMARISSKFTYDLRSKIIRKINKLPLKYFDSKTNGEVLSLITNDVDIINQNINESMTELITSLVMIIGILIMMLSINFIMTIITIIILPISLFISGKLVTYGQNYFKKGQDLLAKVNGLTEEDLTNHQVIKAFKKEDKIYKIFKEENDNLAKTTWVSNFIAGLLHPIMLFMGNLGYVIVAIMGAVFVTLGKITVGNIQSFITYARNFTNPIANFASIVTELQRMVASINRVYLFLDEKEEEKTLNKETIENVKGNIEFKHVRFGYDENKIIIKDFNLKVKKGEKIAIVGPTGSGKSTLVKLLMRFYDINSGEILIDKVNIKNIDRSDLRNMFGMVLQDTWLFSGTIMENLKYGKLDSSEEEVKNAASRAYIDHFIETLPMGYDMLINEEVTNLSSGQKQLLTIARAILKDPKILILDEATSSVDTRTEELIQKAMDKLMEGKTSFIIAHRLSTVKNADMILVLKEGDVIEVGTHEELLKKKGFYYNLYYSQFETNEAN